MRAPPAVRLERFQKLIEQVYLESSGGSIIIVEGQKDRESLRIMGIKGPVQCLQSSRKNVAGFVERLEELARVVVLTDFDREGVSLAKRLTRSLNARGLRANLVLWKSLRELTRSEIRSIEELPKYGERLQNETHLNHRYFDMVRTISTSRFE
jgi:5S rRNA maturation endonuclease (ribonuclease M5)